MEDVKDILGSSRNDAKNKSEVINREIISLTGGIPPIKPSFSKQVLKGLKEKRNDSRSTEKWSWASFTNPARRDCLQLNHWKKLSDTEDYPFAKFNKSIEMVTYTEEEYTKILHNPSWSKEETDYFWNLCQIYDLRFIVIQDRYNPSYPPRSVEDLKERFYSLSKEILLLRNQTTHPIISLPYNANYEKKRKALLEKYFLRTREQDEEEKALCEEARKLEIRIKKEEKEMKVFEKLMSNNSEEIEFSEWNQNKKELPKGPSLRSAQLFQPALPQRQQKKIESLLKDLLIPDRPMPTAEVIDLYTKLRKELFILLNLQKHVIKKENEKKNLEDRIREAKANQTKKSVSNSSNTMKSAQHAMAPAKVNTIKAPAALSNRQTIGPMNNLNSSYTTPRKSNQKGRSDGLEEADQVTPIKRLKKSQNP